MWWFRTSRLLKNDLGSRNDFFRFDFDRLESPTVLGGTTCLYLSHILLISLVLSFKSLHLTILIITQFWDLNISEISWFPKSKRKKSLREPKLFFSSFEVRNYHTFLFEALTQRLYSYGNWPKSAKIWPQELAEAGFFYLGNNLNLKCPSCGLQTNINDLYLGVSNRLG
jgi:hypothetical protein